MAEKRTRFLVAVKFTNDSSFAAKDWFVKKLSTRGTNGGRFICEVRGTAPENELILVAIEENRLLAAAEYMEIKKTWNDGSMKDFLRNQADKFRDYDATNAVDFFTVAEQQKIIFHEIESVRATDNEPCVPGHTDITFYTHQAVVPKLVSCELIQQIFPLHDKDNLKQLRTTWTTKVLKSQPIERIRDYFGETIAMYFAFLNFYTFALFIPASVSMLFMVLPLDGGLSYQTFLCVFNLIWATVFLEIWKRKCAGYSYHWGTWSMAQFEETRPAYFGTLGTNPVTGKLEPQYPKRKRLVRFYFVSVPAVTFWLCLAVGVMRLYFSFEFHVQNFLAEQKLGVADSALRLLPTIIYAVSIAIMNGFYRRFAKILTDYENHRLHSSYTNHLIFKLVLFDFVNSFMWLFYVAFVMQDLPLLRKSMGTLLITQQIIGQFQEVFLPYLSMKVRKKKIKRSLKESSPSRGGGTLKKLTDEDLQAAAGDTNANKPRKSATDTEAGGDGDDGGLSEVDEAYQQALVETEKDEYMEPLDDYLELFLQFGYVFLFSAVFPPAALCALINNVTEIRADAFKLCHNCQRPFSRPASSIGAWQTVFEVMNGLAIITNCALLALSPQAASWKDHLGSVTFILGFIALEHMMFLLKIVLSTAIPDKPKWVEVAISKLQYQSKQAYQQQQSTSSG